MVRRLESQATWVVGKVNLTTWIMDGWIMFVGPKAQHWDQQCHSAPKKRKKEMR